MTQPLYFLPGVHRAALDSGGRLTQSLLKERGLAEVFADVGPGDYGTMQPNTVGPGGKSGIYLYYLPPEGREPPRLQGYVPEQQEWHELQGGELWLGLDKSSPPTPGDLRRKSVIPGYLAKLGDGNQWNLPLVRQHGGGTQLPQNFSKNGHGLELAVKPNYRRLWEDSEVVANWCFNGGEMAMEEAIDRAVSIVGVNYRFGWNEQNALALIDTSNWEVILGATVDAPKVLRMWEETQKKSEAESQPTANT